MTLINMLEAKTGLTQLIRKLEKKEEDEILICRNGIPVAKLVRYEKKNKRIGIAEGYFSDPDLDEFNSMNEEIAKEFYGE